VEWSEEEEEEEDKFLYIYRSGWRGKEGGVEHTTR